MARDFPYELLNFFRTVEVVEQRETHVLRVNAITARLGAGILAQIRLAKREGQRGCQKDDCERHTERVQMFSADDIPDQQQPQNGPCDDAGYAGPNTHVHHLLHDPRPPPQNLLFSDQPKPCIMLQRFLSLNPTLLII